MFCFFAENCVRSFFKEQGGVILESDVPFTNIYYTIVVIISIFVQISDEICLSLCILLEMFFVEADIYQANQGLVP